MLAHTMKEISIFHAVELWATDAIQKILSDAPHACLIRNEYGELPISIAAQSKQFGLVSILLQHAIDHGYQYPVCDALVWVEGRVGYHNVDQFNQMIKIIQNNRSLFSDKLPESHFQAIVNNQHYFESDPTRWYETNEYGLTAAFFSVVLGYTDQKKFTKEIILPSTRELNDDEWRKLLVCHYHLSKPNNDPKVDFTVRHLNNAVNCYNQIKDKNDIDLRYGVRAWSRCVEFCKDQPHKVRSNDKSLCDMPISICENIKVKQDIDWRILADSCFTAYKLTQKDPEKDIEYLLKAIAARDKIKDKNEDDWHKLAEVHYKAANHYLETGEYRKDVEHLLKAIASLEKLLETLPNRVDGCHFDDLAFYHHELAITYRNEGEYESAEEHFRKARTLFDDCWRKFFDDEEQTAPRQIFYSYPLIKFLNRNQEKPFEAAQLALESLKKRNACSEKKYSLDENLALLAKHYNFSGNFAFDLQIKRAIKMMLNQKMFDKAARCFIDFIELYYLYNNVSKRNLNGNTKCEDFYFVTALDSRESKYPSLYAYKKTYATLLDLTARIFKTEEAPDLPNLFSEISTVLKTEFYITHPSIRSALILLTKAIRYALENGPNKDCMEFINPSFQSICKEGKKEMLQLIETLESKLQSDFSLRAHLVSSVLNENAILKDQNKELMSELNAHKKEKADQLSAQTPGFFPQAHKRERNDADEELIREDEETKRIKIESLDEGNNPDESDAEPSTKKNRREFFK